MKPDASNLHNILPKFRNESGVYVSFDGEHWERYSLAETKILSNIEQYAASLNEQLSRELDSAREEIKLLNDELDVVQCIYCSAKFKKSDPSAIVKHIREDCEDRPDSLKYMTKLSAKLSEIEELLNSMSMEDETSC